SPTSTGPLTDMVSQTAGLWNLHLGHEFGAPARLVEHVGKSVVVAIMTRKGPRIRSVRRQQGEYHAPVPMLIHQLVVIAGTVPASGHIDMLAVRQFRVVQVTGLVPARHLEPTALNEEEVHCMLGRFGENYI